MNKVFVVKITFMRHMKFSGHVERVDTKIFSSLGRAEEFLKSSDFVYSDSYYFNGIGWRHKGSIKPQDYICPLLIYADILEIEIDAEEENYKLECLNFMNK